MRILLDLQGCQLANTEMPYGGYSQQLAKALLRQGNGCDFRLAMNSRLPNVSKLRHKFSPYIAWHHMLVFDIPGPIALQDQNNTWRNSAAKLIWQDFVEHADPDILFLSDPIGGFDDDAVTSIGDRQTAQTVSALFEFDTIFNEKPISHSRKMWRRERIETLRQSRLLLVKSDCVRQIAVSRFGLDPERIISIPAGVEEKFCVRPQPAMDGGAICTHLGLKKPFLLFVNSQATESSMDKMLCAFSLLQKELRASYQLVIATPPPAIAIETKQNIFNYYGEPLENVVFTGNLSNDDLISLYHSCHLAVIPESHTDYEQIAAEAMCCGAPVIASRAGGLPEVVGREDALFAPLSAASISEKLSEVLSCEGKRQSLAAHALRQGQKFTWAAIADRILATFETIAQGTSSRSTPRRTNDLYRSPVNAIARQTLCTALRNIRGNTGPALTDLAASAACIAANDTTSSAPRIFVDVSAIREVDQGTGIQRVVKNIVRCLAEEEDIEFVAQPVYVCRNTTNLRYDYTWLYAPDKADTYDESIIEFGCNDIFVGLDLSVDTVHFGEKKLREMRDKGVRIYFVVYDLLPIHFPHYFPEGVSRAFTTWLRSITELADGIVCISKAVANELLGWLARNKIGRNDSQLKIGYFHLGSNIEDDIGSIAVAPEIQRMLNVIAQNPFLLMVGTLEPRKGHAQAVAAFDLLWRRGVDVNLVIVGKQGWEVESLINRLHTHPELGKRLFWFEQPGDEVLLKLYEAASGLLAASEGEGFGLPLVEAARRKIPIIARDLPVFKEIGKENAYFFSGKKPGDLADAVQNWLRQKEKGKIPCPENILCLTWAESTAQLHDVLVHDQWLYIWPPNCIESWNGHRAVENNSSISSITASYYSEKIRNKIKLILECDFQKSGNLSQDKNDIKVTLELYDLSNCKNIETEQDIIAS